VNLSSLRYLVVDDSLTIRKAVTQILSALGVTSVAGANTGEQAWTLLIQAAESGIPFDFVISDWHMPDISGLDLAKRCRKNPLTSHIGFVMLTNEVDAQNVVEAMLVGADNYIVKPVEPMVLKDKLTSVYKKRFGKK
jgi:two-component system, chemotaxis family, chemotaxis protein CheY